MAWSLDYTDWRIYKRYEDLNAAYLIGLREAPAAIYAETSYHVEEFIKGILPALLQMCIVQGASTAIGAGLGAGLGAFVFGAGAIPGAAIGAEAGFDLGLLILGWLGLAFLVAAIGHSLGELVALVKTAIVQAWGAADKGEARGQNVRMAGQTLARAIAILVRLILTGIVAWLTKKGIDKAPELIAELKASKLGAGFAEWVEKNLSRLTNDPKLRGHKQGEGSSAKAPDTQAQTPSQLAERSAHEPEPFRGTIKYRTAKDANAELCDRGLARPDTAPFKEGTPVTERTAAVGERFKMAVSQEQYERIVDSGGRQGIGGWGSSESLPSSAAVRERLAITPEFKPDISHVIEVEVTQPGLRVLEGTAAPIPPYGGGGQQIFFDTAPALRANVLKVVPGSASTL